MKLLWIAVAFGIALLALPDAPVSPVDTAAAEVCRADDLDCHERKINCVVRTATHPTDPRLCTQ